MATIQNIQVEKLLEQQDYASKYRMLKDVILFVGETGKGKSALTEFLGGRQLRAQGSNGLYVIVDDNGRIGASANTILSQTTSPETVWHEQLPPGVHYLDCPGFEDTRGSIMDALCTTFTVAALQSCRSVKLVLVTSYDDVKIGGNRNGFMNLVKILTSFLSNLDKFHRSVALFVTKVPNIPIFRDGAVVYVGAEEMREHVVEFLLSVKTTVSTEENVGQEKSLVYKNAIKLIDMILPESEPKMWTARIGTFPCPDRKGLIHTMQLFQEARVKLNYITHDILEFVAVDASDFNPTISPESKLYFRKAIEDIVQMVSEILQNLFEQIGSCYEEYQKDSVNIETLDKGFSEQNKIWDDTFNAMQNLESTTDVFKYFLEQITRLLSTHVLANWRTQLSKDIEKMTRMVNTIDMVEKVSNENYRISTSIWLQQFNDMKNMVQNIHLWYDALIKVFQVFASYEWQRDRDSTQESKFLEKLRQWLSPGLNEERDISTRDIRDAVFDVSKVTVVFHRCLRASPTMVQHLLNLSEFAFGKTAVTSVAGKFRIEGPFLMLSDIIAKLDNVQQLEILATFKLFIDCDVTSVGKELQVVIIAPVWEVVGGNHSIILDGAEGQSSEGAASEGADGEPGGCGGCGGTLIGIGNEIINGEKLIISTNGGNGGRGQNGGEGANGENGIDATPALEQSKWFWEDPFDFHYSKMTGETTSRSCNLIFRRYETRQKYLSLGTNGKPGADGGNGGRGGHGGFPGHVLLFGIEHGNSPQVCAAIGSEGKVGKGATGGAGGSHGKNCSFVATCNEPVFDLFDWTKYLTISEKKLYNRRKADDGTAGIDGGSKFYPIRIYDTHQHSSDFISLVKDYVSIMQGSKYLPCGQYQSIDKIMSKILMFENWNDLKFLTKKTIDVENNQASILIDQIDANIFYTLLQYFIILFVCGSNQLNEAKASIASFIFLVSLVRKQTKLNNIQDERLTAGRLPESVVLYLDKFAANDSDTSESNMHLLRLLEGVLDNTEDLDDLDYLLQDLRSIGIFSDQLDRARSQAEFNCFCFILKNNMFPADEEFAEDASYSLVEETKNAIVSYIGSLFTVTPR